jgi:hypothetical protein
MGKQQGREEADCLSNTHEDPGFDLQQRNGGKGGRKEGNRLRKSATAERSTKSVVGHAGNKVTLY